MKIKLNKYLFFSFIIFSIIVGISFFQYFHEYYSYSKYYYEIKRDCYEKENLENPICERFEGEYLESYILNNDPAKKFEQLDSLTLSYSIVETTLFSNLQFLFPLITLIAFVGDLHPFFSNGEYQTFLLRDDYKSVFKKIMSKSIICSIIIPIILLIIFIFSSIITGFDYTIVDELKNIAVYSDFKYSSFLIYGLLICLIQFFINMMYCNIGLFSCLRSKNTIVSIFISYIYSLLFNIFIYVVLYALVLNKMFGIKEMSDYFNIFGYWSFSDTKGTCISLGLSIIFYVSTLIINYLVYKNVEKVIVKNDKIIA